MLGSKKWIQESHKSNKMEQSKMESFRPNLWSKINQTVENTELD